MSQETQTSFEHVLSARDISTAFPVNSQTTAGDKRFLLSVVNLIRNTNTAYSYLEIGSFLGGSLTPFLMDTHCARITSVDDRGKLTPDERGIQYDYGAFSTQMMLDGLTDVGLSVDKLTCVDGTSKDAAIAGPFDMIHIDAIHTDEAVFEDFLASRKHGSPDCIYLFHDYDLIFKGIDMIRLLLASEGAEFGLVVGPETNFCVILVGRSAALAPALGHIGDQAFATRREQASRLRILHQFRNRSYVPGPDGLKKFELPQEVGIGGEQVLEVLRS